MEMEEMEIRIPLDGTIHVGTRGFKGSRCIAATKALEEATGTLIRQELTAEYFSEQLTESARQVYQMRDGDRKSMQGQ